MGRPSHLATKYHKPFRLIVFLLPSSLVTVSLLYHASRSMLTVRVPFWILQAPNLLWRRHFLRAFLGAVALRTQIRLCKLILEAIDEQQSRFLVREFLIRHFPFRSIHLFLRRPSITESFYITQKSALDRISLGRDPIRTETGACLSPAGGSPMIKSNHEAWQSVMDTQALLYVA